MRALTEARRSLSACPGTLYLGGSSHVQREISRNKHKKKFLCETSFSEYITVAQDLRTVLDTLAVRRRSRRGGVTLPRHPSPGLEGWQVAT